MISLRKAINEKCKECLHDSSYGHGRWREQVEACTSYTCPLYAVRPTSKKFKDLVENASEDAEKAI